MNERLRVLNIWVDPVSRAEAVARVGRFLEKGTRAHSVFASNPEKNFALAKDPWLHQIYRNADLLLPDGIGVVFAVRLLYGLRIARIPGSEFIFELCALAERCDHPVFVYGARENVNRLTAEKLQERYPQLVVAGRSNGYVADNDMPELITQINQSGASILFLALGSPKQEKWFGAHGHELEHVRVCQAVGGTLDTIAGIVKRAPDFWRRCNAEWLYRLLKEPKRIQRQRVLPVFAALVAWTWLKQRIDSR